MSAIGGYFRGRMHRRIFLWLAMSILLTGLTVAGVLSLTGKGQFGRNVEQMSTFVGERFAQLWDQPTARDDLARTIARDFDVDVDLVDDRRATLWTSGGHPDHFWIDADVRRDGQLLGKVRIAPHHPHGSPRRILLALFAAGSVLWIAAGKISRRITRPIDELVRVAESIGAGKLDARVRVRRGDRHGDVHILGCVMNEMAARIEKQMADQRELLAAVSHEIRTPLARIRLLSEMARDGQAAASEATAKREKLFDDLDREVVEIDRLVSELLASSRLQFAALVPKTLDAAEVAADALERAGLSTDLLIVETKSRAFDADPTLVARALANLVDNARRHGGGLKELRVVGDDDRVCFEAHDGGPGFSAGDERAVFDAFVQKSANGTLGLGLSLVRRIAEAHGGGTWAKNRDGGGACVAIELPRRSKTESQTEPHPPSPPLPRRERGEREGVLSRT